MRSHEITRKHTLWQPGLVLAQGRLSRTRAARQAGRHGHPLIDYNGLNSSAIRTYNQTFIVNGAWLTPALVLPARFATLTAQVDF
jgi:hypothetical protein